MNRLLPALALCCGLSSTSWGQLPSDSISPGEFPALQVLPPGSIIKGITLPRYQSHRVIALLKAAELKILSRTNVQMNDIQASLYDNQSETTSIRIPSAEYSFANKLLQSSDRVSVESPRFSASGNGISFNTASRKGYVRGPVRTTMQAGSLIPDSRRP